MRGNAVDVDLRRRRDPFENVDCVLFQDTHSPVAGIDLEIDRDASVFGERFSFRRSGDGRNETAFDDY